MAPLTEVLATPLCRDRSTKRPVTGVVWLLIRNTGEGGDNVKKETIKCTSSHNVAFERRYPSVGEDVRKYRVVTW